MNILLVYATYSSGTYSASQIATEILKSKGHSVTVQLAKDTVPGNLGEYDLVILASPSWEVEKQDGQPHIDFVDLIKRSQGIQVQEKNFAIFGLGDQYYPRFCGAVDHLEKFVREIGGRLVIDSLRINRYLFHEEANNQILNDWIEKLSNTATDKKTDS